jgi:hypothetical protein
VVARPGVVVVEMGATVEVVSPTGRSSAVGREEVEVVACSREWEAEEASCLQA